MIFDTLLDKMQTLKQLPAKYHLMDCHADGLFSLVIDGEMDKDGNFLSGTLTRVFIATKKIKPFTIQLHSHKYDLTIGVIHGCFQHHIADVTNDIDFVNIVGKTRMKRYQYKSPINGESSLEYLDQRFYSLSSNHTPVGGEIFLPHDLIHTVSCDKGTIWVVQEHELKTDSNIVLGVPFKTTKLYKQPTQEEVSKMGILVYEKLKDIM